MTTDPEWAPRFADAWVSAWNRRDLEAVLAFYAEAIRFQSPLARKLTGQGVVEGRAALRAYWSEGLARRPALHFELLDLFIGDDALALHLRDETGRRSVETLVFDEAGQVIASTGCYLA